MGLSTFPQREQVELFSATLSGTSVPVNNIPQGYTDLMILVTGVNISAIGNVEIGFSNTVYGELRSNQAGTVATAAFTNTSLYGGTSHQAGNADNTFLCYIRQYSSTSVKKQVEASGVFQTSTPATRAWWFNGVLNSTAAVSSFTLTSSQTLNGGTIRVFGIA